MRRTIPALVLASALGCASPSARPADERQPTAKAPRRNASVEEITIIVAGAD